MSFYDGDYDTVMRFSTKKEDELKEMLSCLPDDMRPKMDNWIRMTVKEEIKSSQATSSTHDKSRSLKLTISNINSPLLTGDLIKGEGDMPVTVTLVDSHTNKEVKTGPEASGRVEITVLKAEFNNGRNEFEGKIVHYKEGNKSVHVDNLCLDLKEGTAVLPKISFARSNSKWLKISKIRLHARFVDNFSGIQVKEAQTEPFVLKDSRNAAYNKHPIPCLDDQVWRLNNIDRRGLLASNLIKAKIQTVRDFIHHLFVYPQSLHEIFEGANHAKSLKGTIKHARECRAKFKYFCSIIDQKSEVVFNVSGQVLGLYKEDQFISSDIFSETQQEIAKKLVISAFENWGDVKEEQFVDNQTTKTEIVTVFDKCVFFDGLELDVNEISLFGNNGQYPDPQSLPEALRARYHEIYHGFESVKKNKFFKRWRMFCLVTVAIGSLVKRSSGGGHVHKKQRLS